jgi:hypothetical protein
MKNMRFTICALAMLLAFGCAGGPATNDNAGPVFNWSNKLVLSKNQYDLIYFYTKLESADAEKQAELKEKISRLAAQLGTNMVRRARSGELVATKTATNVASIHNPSHDNVAFTVSIRGDEEWNGSRKASIGRDTYLPANGTLIVTNIYWTTPSMSAPKKE